MEDHQRRDLTLKIEFDPPLQSKTDKQKQYKAAYMARLKANPVAYDRSKKQKAEDSRERRLQQKTSLTVEQRSRLRHLARLRQKSFRQRQRQTKPEVPQTKLKTSKTRACERVSEARRERNRLAQKKRRENMSSQKKQLDLERNRHYYYQQKKADHRPNAIENVSQETQTNFNSSSSMFFGQEDIKPDLDSFSDPESPQSSTSYISCAISTTPATTTSTSVAATPLALSRQLTQGARKHGKRKAEEGDENQEQQEERYYNYNAGVSKPSESRVGVGYDFRRGVNHEDQHDVFGRTVAFKLRQMAQDQGIHAEKIISDVLYEGMLGNLSRGSCLISSNSNIDH